MRPKTSQISNGVRFQKNVPLKKFTTFKIGGPARYFFVAKTKKELIKAIQRAKKQGLPFFILGGGSNLLVSDKGYKGLVIKAGKPLSLYVSKGLEWAVGIPGTIEGAVYGNAGAFGQSMKDVVESVEVFDAAVGQIKIFKNSDCQFAYRDSAFKRNKNLVILSVKIKPKKSNPSKIKEYLNCRKEKQPLGLPSAGSVFKNPQNYFAGGLGEENKFSSSAFTAARLIEKCGLKGKKIGGAQISNVHANFIVNSGGATAQNVLGLIKLIKKTVMKKFKIALKEEIIFLK